MNGVKSEGIHVIRKAARAADSRNNYKIFALKPQLGEDRLHCRQDGVITAARAPTDLLIRLKIFFCERRRQSCGTHFDFSWDRHSLWNASYLVDLLHVQHFLNF